VSATAPRVAVTIVSPVETGVTTPLMSTVAIVGDPLAHRTPPRSGFPLPSRTSTVRVSPVLPSAMIAFAGSIRIDCASVRDPSGVTPFGSFESQEIMVVAMVTASTACAPRLAGDDDVIGSPDLLCEVWEQK
jgi:hypothetical protein